jgi:hypothetical protein
MIVSRLEMVSILSVLLASHPSCSAITNGCPVLRGFRRAGTMDFALIYTRTYCAIGRFALVMPACLTFRGFRQLNISMFNAE